MSQTINFPNSMNLSQVKATAETTMKADFMSFASQNQTYGARDTIRIPIPNTANTWLHGNDSFMSLRLKNNATVTGGKLSIDGNIYSLFRNARLIQAGNLLVEQNDCNRLWQALFDLQVSSSQRSSKEITMGIDFSPTDKGLFGNEISNGKYSYFSFPLPMSIIGTLSEKSFPLGALSTGMVLELDVEDINKFLTTRISNDTPEGQQTTSTALSLTSLEIDQIYYHAKVSNVGMYNQLLLNALGPSITIPGTEYRSDKKDVPAGTVYMSPNFSFPLKSAKSILFWFTNSKTANGVIDTFKLNSAITQRRAGGNLKEYYVAIDGSSFPTIPIDASAGSNLANNNIDNNINGSIPLQHLLRCFNLNSAIDSGGVLNSSIYNSTHSSWANDAFTSRCILGIDLDRGSNDGDKFFQGVNIQNSVLSIRATWNTAATEAQTLYTYVMHDVAFVIQDGVCMASR